jgi:heme/copper-type cytochrome/quinol oxidase subunit 4
MNEMQTAKQHNAGVTGESELHEHAVDFRGYLRRCLYVFIAVVCTTALMIWISFLPHYGWPVKAGLILCVACVNAFLVAGFLMHLLSEKKMIYTLLGFVVVFFAGLMGLTIYAMQDMPTGTVFH